MDKILRGTPVVCAVGENYIICIAVKKPVFICITVDNEKFFCHSNGVRKCNVDVQKFTIPMQKLNNARSYTVTYEKAPSVMPSKMPPEIAASEVAASESPVSIHYDFKPLEKTDNINIYHISDSHGAAAAAIKTGKFFSDDLDLLILNGDIANKMNSRKDLFISLDIASAITGGRIPCIITRGNHDLRGRLAEKLEDYIPTDYGKTYYSVKLGSLWILLLDCGEDKEDTHKEYSGTVCCHDFRLEETAFIKEIIANASEEYASPEVRHRIILSHIPFNMNNTDECKGERPFNIEIPLYSQWCNLIRENIHPDFLLAGHIHDCKLFSGSSSDLSTGHSISTDSDNLDAKHLGSDTILGGAPVRSDNRSCNHPGSHITGVIGTAITLTKEQPIVRFTGPARS